MTWPVIREAYIGQPPITALYQPIEHPDFAGWPVVRECGDRMALMTAYLTARGVMPGTVLDLGCHTGWFCRAFARLGWQAIGIDRSAPWLDVALAMNESLDEHRPRYVLGDIETMALPQADVALCLSCAMYLSWDQPLAWRLMHRLSDAAPVLFMDIGGMYAHRMPFTEATVVEQMIAQTRYTHGAVLGRTGDEQRPLVVFTR